MELNKNSRFWTIISFVFMIFVVYFVAKNIRDVERFIAYFGIAGPLVSIILYGLLAPTPIPTDPLTIINGVMFGPFWGIIISWLGNNLAAGVEYYIGTHLGNITKFKEGKKKLPFGLSILPVDSAWFLVLGRMIPGYGAKIISFLAGIYHVPIKLYLWTTALTNLIGSIILAFGGYSLIQSLKL